MTVDEIFKKISKHMVEGVMIHEEMANYFAFLRLDEYEIIQVKRYMDESESLNKLYSYFIKHYGKLMPKLEISSIPQIIPSSLYNHSIDDLSSNDIRQSVKEIMKTWVEWEESTKELYEESYTDLIDNNADVSSAIVVMKLLEEVNDELQYAKQIWYKLKNSNFDIVFIMEEQDTDV